MSNTITSSVPATDATDALASRLDAFAAKRDELRALLAAVRAEATAAGRASERSALRSTRNRNRRTVTSARDVQ